MVQEALNRDALRESWAIQAEASALGFDWPEVGGVLDKIAEELAELRDALGRGDCDAIQHELGDLFLAAVNAARFLEIDPAQALLAANARFMRRFALVKTLAAEAGLPMKTCSPEQLDMLWSEAKVREHHTLENTP